MGPPPLCSLLNLMTSKGLASKYHQHMNLGIKFQHEFQTGHSNHTRHPSKKHFKCCPNYEGWRKWRELLESHPSSRNLWLKVAHITAVTVLQPKQVTSKSKATETHNLPTFLEGESQKQLCNHKSHLFWHLNSSLNLSQESFTFLASQNTVRESCGKAGILVQWVKQPLMTPASNFGVRDGVLATLLPV